MTGLHKYVWVCVHNYHVSGWDVHSLTSHVVNKHSSVYWAFLIAQLVKNLPAMQETLGQFLGWEDLLEKRTPVFLGFPCGSACKESACNAGDLGLIPVLGRERLPTPVFWPGEFHRLYSPWGHKESDMTERLSLHFCVPGLPDGASGRTTHLPMQETIRDTSSIPGLGRSSGGGLAWELTPVFLPGESLGQRRLVGYSP